MRPFAAAEADVRSEDDFSGKKKGEAAAETLVEIGKIQIAAGEGDFSGIVKQEQADGADDATVVLRLDEKRIGTAEAKIAEGAERWLIVDVGAADSFLKIKRNGVGGAGVRHGDADARGENTVKTAMAIFGFGIEAMAEIHDEAAERIVTGVRIVEIAVAEAIVELKMIRSEREMGAEKTFEVNERRLRGEAGSGLFGVGLTDGNDFRGIDIADAGKNRFECGAGREPGSERTGDEATDTRIALAEVDGVVDIGAGAETVERKILHLFVVGVKLKSKIFVGVKVAKMRTARGEFCLGEPELTDGDDASEFEAILPDVAVEIAAVVAAATDTTTGNDALRKEMERTGTERTCGTGEKRVLAEVLGHVVAIFLPVCPVVGVRDRFVALPHGRICGRTAGGDLREDAGSGHRKEREDEKESDEQLGGAGTKVHGWSFLVSSSTASAGGTGRLNGLSEKLGLDAEEKIGGLFFRANVGGVDAGLLGLRKQRLFKVGGHFDVSGEVIVDVGVQVSGVEMSLALRDDRGGGQSG